MRKFDLFLAMCCGALLLACFACSGLPPGATSARAALPAHISWEVHTDQAFHRWVAIAIVGLDTEPVLPNTVAEVPWPEALASRPLCIDNFQQSSDFPEQPLTSYTAVGEMFVGGGKPELTVRRLCYDSEKPDIYLHTLNDGSHVFHLLLAGDLCGEGGCQQIVTQCGLPGEAACNVR